MAQVPSDQVDAVEGAVASQAKHFQAQYGLLERQMEVSVQRMDGGVPQQALTQDSAHRLLTLLLVLPHGPLKFSHAVKGTQLYFELHLRVKHEGGLVCRLSVMIL